MSGLLDVRIECLPHAEGLPLPSYATSGAAGMDLVAAVEPAETLVLHPFERALIPTGLRMAIPVGFEAQIRPRSGLALKHGVTIINSPGTIDSDYRGEVKILLVNCGNTPFNVTRGLRIAQMVFAPCVRASFRHDAIDVGETARSQGGFGSSGL